MFRCPDKIILAIHLTNCMENVKWYYKYHPVKESECDPSMQLNIPLSDQYKAMIVEAIVKGNDDDYRDFVFNKNTITNNGNAFCRMDYINTRINFHLPPEEFNVTTVKRGRFEHIQIYDKQNENLFVVMGEPRYRTVRDNANLTSSHYVEIYATRNEHLSSDISWDSRPGQMGFDFLTLENSLVNEKYAELKELSLKLLGNRKVNMTTIITFHLGRNQKVEEVIAYVPDINMANPSLCEEDWSKWITVDYSSYIVQENDTTVIDELELDLKQSVKDKLNNIDLTLKQTDEEEEGNK